MRRAFGLFELLLVILVVIIFYTTVYSGKKVPVQNYLESNSQVKSQQQLIDDKLSEIEKIKLNKINAEKTIYEGN